MSTYCRDLATINLQAINILVNSHGHETAGRQQSVAGNASGQTRRAQIWRSCSIDGRPASCFMRGGYPRTGAGIFAVHGAVWERNNKTLLKPRFCLKGPIVLLTATMTIHISKAACLSGRARGSYERFQQANLRPAA